MFKISLRSDEKAFFKFSRNLFQHNYMIIGAKLGGADGALAPPLFLLSPGICFKLVIYKYFVVKSPKIPVLHQHYLSHFGANGYYTDLAFLKME